MLLILSMAHLFCNSKKKQEAPKINENELPRNSIGENQNELFHSYHNSPLYPSSRPSMVSRDASKGTTSQRRRRLHRSPLNLPEENFQMPNISMEKISTFFGNDLEDADKHLFRFQCACEIFNLTKDNVTCILFLQTLCGNSLEWYSSLLPGTITSWDILEYLFVEIFSHAPCCSRVCVLRL